MYFEQPEGVAIHSGFPNPASDTSLQTLDLNQLLIKNSASTFFLRISGGDWTSQGVFSGDLVIVDRAISPRLNDLVVWLNKDEFTISPAHKAPKSSPVWGVVTATIHDLRSKK